MYSSVGKATTQVESSSANEKLLNAAFVLIRTKGYSSTTIDQLCEHAGVTKGGFFHHFSGKEDFAVKVAQHWSLTTGKLFDSAPYHRLHDPLERLLGYIEFRKQILRGKIPEFTCLVGTMVQETYDSNPAIRMACKLSIFGHAETLESDIQAAKALYQPKATWTAKSLALHTQAVIQGAFILAKASGRAEPALTSIDHLKNYVQLLFNKQTTKKGTPNV